MKGVTMAALAPRKDQITQNAGDYNDVSEIYNYRREMFQQTIAQQKGQLQNTIRQKENLVSFNSSSPRFQAKKQIQIVTGQDAENGDLYIIKDDKSNLGPGYYRNQDEIQNMKDQFSQILLKNRFRKRNSSL